MRLHIEYRGWFGEGGAVSTGDQRVVLVHMDKRQDGKRWCAFIWTTDEES